MRSAADHWGETEPPYPAVPEPSPRGRPEVARVSPGGAPLPAMIRPRNPLLVRDEIGKAKATCYQLPPSDVPFGSAGARDPEGAREVTMQWKSHSPRVRREERVPDFRQFNKQALKSGICTAKDQGKFIRQVPDLPEYSPGSITRVSPKALPPESTPGQAFGMKGRVSTPIDQVLSNKWATEGEEELQVFYVGMLLNQSRPAHARKIHLTQASRGHAAAARVAQQPTEPRELYKMKKFQNVRPKTSSFRPNSLLQARRDEDFRAGDLDPYSLEPPPPSLMDD